MILIRSTANRERISKMFTNKEARKRRNREEKFNAAIKGRKLSVRTRYKIADKFKVSWYPCEKCLTEHRHTDLIFRPLYDEPLTITYDSDDEDAVNFLYACNNDKKNYRRLCKSCFDLLVNGPELKFKN